MLVAIVVAVVLLAAGGVTVAALFGGGDVHAKALPAPGATPSDTQQARKLAHRLAAGMSGDSAEALAAISCSTPSQKERAAFNTEATKSDFTFTVIGEPHVNGDIATGKIQGQVKVLHYTLHKRQSGWCADFDWSALL